MMTMAIYEFRLKYPPCLLMTPTSEAGSMSSFVCGFSNNLGSLHDVCSRHCRPFIVADKVGK